MNKSFTKAGLIIAFWFLYISITGYEDNTHQRLTDKAIKVAIEKGGLPADFFTAQQKAQIIAGAGGADGEDYTKYKIIEEGNCTKKKKAANDPYKRECLHHFYSGMFGFTPAKYKEIQFFWDAVELWKSGNKDDAAFILGRACHLVEDMAQPQHAMDVLSAEVQ